MHKTILVSSVQISEALKNPQVTTYARFAFLALFLVGAVCSSFAQASAVDSISNNLNSTINTIGSPFIQFLIGPIPRWMSLFTLIGAVLAFMFSKQSQGLKTTGVILVVSTVALFLAGPLVGLLYNSAPNTAQYLKDAGLDTGTTTN